MRNKLFSSRWGGLGMVLILSVLLGIAVMPACSKKSAEEAPPAGTTAAPDGTGEEKADAVSQPQPAAPAAALSPEMAERQQLIQELRQSQKELADMQATTLNNHPELLKEQEGLRTLIQEKMQALLKPQNLDIQQIQQIQQKLQDQTLPQEQKTALMMEFQEKARLYNQARVGAMNDEQVKETYRQYETHLKELMIAENPTAPEKIASFEKTQAALQQLGNKIRAGAAAAPATEATPGAAPAAEPTAGTAPAAETTPAAEPAPSN